MWEDPEQPEWFNKIMRSQQSKSEPPVAGAARGCAAPFDRQQTVQWFNALPDNLLAAVWQYADGLVKSGMPTGPWQSRKCEWVRAAAAELAMDSAHIPLIEEIILKHWKQHNEKVS